METLRPVPFLGHAEDGVKEWVSSNLGEILPDKIEVLKYLRNNYCIAAVPAIVRDPFDPERILRDTRNIITDGVWVWIQSTAYLVEEYDLKLPGEFLTYVRSIDFRVSKARARKQALDMAHPWLEDSRFFWPSHFNDNAG
ncbi:hypothetical protein [Lignipirellula cremea]|uniref:Uncharacterized protein n=1 Tax=Lignipirellula cremea TaxID=2528010 RepID=A0A518DNL9_9BACT|nr:hypothetical protein [Lignipirellula cremea]QDU93435.1 hypothetical protein Pla8534_12150 [Lignipirellula cremea]